MVAKLKGIVYAAVTAFVRFVFGSPNEPTC